MRSGSRNVYLEQLPVVVPAPTAARSSLDYYTLDYYREQAEFARFRT